MSVLFADLAEFSATAERLDPEDVRAVQEPYWRQVRREIERFGGTVEKFIGDAVVALFGAPIAHEDDPERAVRAGLAIRDWAEGEAALSVRTAITTGEVLVRLDARPLAGEGMASGDVVNTASRLQALAPLNGVLVDEPTRRATAAFIDYADAELVSVKGKADRVRVWEALQARSHFGVDVVHARAPLVGRERELDVLNDALRRVREERVPELVTLVGVPGIGKSRLVYELMRGVRDDPSGLVAWRQGRSLPYGDGVSFWALGEIVKAETGILETEQPLEAERKLRENLHSLVEREEEAAWLERHLRPLAGLPVDGVEAEQNEVLAAWRRYVEALADRRPLVLVFEDLHWADEGLLDFVDHLVEWATGVPLMVVATARPELFDRRPYWGGGKLNSVTLALSPLVSDDIRLLIEALIEGELDPMLEGEVIEQVGGNPLFAEQFAQISLDGSPGLVELSKVETVQALIAARLDLLPDQEKSMLQDAAVVGKVFWLDSVIADRPRATVEETLHALERKGFIARAQRSSFGEEREYSFSHILVRDVSYGQIARADRADKHLRTAAWLESATRREEQAETLAHHYSAALELARAIGNPPMDRLLDMTRLALRDAGDRAFGLKAFSRAVRHYEDALTLWPESDRDRGRVLFGFASALQAVGDGRDEETMVSARVAFVAAQDFGGAAEADTWLAVTCHFQGRAKESNEHLERASHMVEQRPESPEKARVLTTHARLRASAGDYAEGLRVGQEALALAERLELYELQADALVTVGAAKSDLGDPTEAIADMETGIDLAFKNGALKAAQRGLHNLAVGYGFRGEVRRRVELLEESQPLNLQLGDRLAQRHVEALLANAHEYLGEWDDSLRRAEQFIDESGKGSPHLLDPWMLALRARIHFARDERAFAFRDLDSALELARRREQEAMIVDMLAWSARIHAEAGLIEQGQQFADEALSYATDTIATDTLIMAWAADRLERVEQMSQNLQTARPSNNIFLKIASLTLLGDYEEAVALASTTDASKIEADTRLLAARRLIKAGKLADARRHLEHALRFFRSVRATHFINEAEQQLAAASPEREQAAQPHV